MRGDVLFWTSDGSLASRAIALATRGPYVHVSVDLGDGRDIGAHAEDGVAIHQVPHDRGLTKYSVEHHLMRHWAEASSLNAQQFALHAIESGITFLLEEVGNQYGWNNILNNVLKLMHLPYRVSRIDRYDCSSLVTRYLTRVGVDLGDLGEAPDSVSPNDLARALQLPSRPMT